ncbi:MAG TPA: PilZ domain-containing protein [Acidimicrobiia bacterium]|nr:PilZ domain-containing protein [Acidimicrobiia bacterium]
MQGGQIDAEAGAGVEPGDGLTRRDAYRARVENTASVYVLAAETTTPGWRSVQLRDLSASGAGLEVVDLDAREGDDVLVRFAPDGDATAFQLRGRIVRRSQAAARDTYGVRFVSLTTQQADVLHSLVARLALARRGARRT